MNHEMLPSDIFTRPRGWQARISIKKYLTREDDLEPEQVNTLGKKIASVLRREPLFTDEEVIENLEHVDEQDELNSILDDMYDECDRVRILVG